MDHPTAPVAAVPTGPHPRRPVFAWAAIAVAILAFPIAKIAAAVLVTREDLLGYYGLWTGLLTFLVILAIGIVLCGWSFLRGEQPRLISIVATALNVALVVALLVFIS